MLKPLTICFVTLCIGISAHAAGDNPEASASAAADPSAAEQHARQSPFVKRGFVTHVGDRWVGNAVCYGPHRDGQAPGAKSPSSAELLEDLKIMSRHWGMIRMYGSAGATETVLQLIRDKKLDLKVVVGAWIGTEARVDEAGQIVEAFPEAVTANQTEVETAIRLANEYPDIVAGVTVGNETQVFWSFHKVRTPVLINYIRQARSQTKAPVSTADVYSFWNRAESKAVAEEVDFIVTHIYAMWNKQPLVNALAWTKEQYRLGIELHPDHQFVIGEAGWATTIHNEGEQATLIVGEANEDAQQRFRQDYLAWTTENQITNFYFEAFDENWKGGEHPDEVEKHWGLFNADRTPKKAIREQSGD